MIEEGEGRIEKKLKNDGIERSWFQTAKERNSEKGKAKLRHLTAVKSLDFFPFSKFNGMSLGSCQSVRILSY